LPHCTGEKSKRGPGNPAGAQNRAEAGSQQVGKKSRSRLNFGRGTKPPREEEEDAIREIESATPMSWKEWGSASKNHKRGEGKENSLKKSPGWELALTEKYGILRVPTVVVTFHLKQRFLGGGKDER